jgi:hypothetical protein
VQAQAQDDLGSPSYGEHEEAAAGSAAAAATAAAGVLGEPAELEPADICHAGEASELLRALAAAFPEVKALVEDRAVPLPRHGGQRCCIQ